MSIRMTNPKDEKFWIEYREERWTFGDRRKITSSFDDTFVLEKILEYVDAWSLFDVDGNAIALDKEKGIELFDEVDDGLVLPWIIQSWFDARRKRNEPEKNSSTPSENT